MARKKLSAKKRPADSDEEEVVENPKKTKQAPKEEEKAVQQSKLSAFLGVQQLPSGKYRG